MHRIRLGIVLIVLATAAFGCGGDGDSGRKAAKQPTGDVEEQLGFNQDGIIARQARVEAATRDCMKEHGFDYIPVDPVAQRAALFGSSRLSEDDFIRQFGYGISTLWGRGGPTVDPNARLRASLAPADRRAYDRVLWGDNPGATFAEAADSGNFTKLGGCVREATERVMGSARVITQLQTRLDEMEERMLQDQRMVRAIERWSACMAGRGFRYDDPEAIDQDLFDRTEAIVGKLPGQFATGPAPGETPQPYDHAALAALQREEVAIAVADHDCERREITPVERVVSPHYQQQFRQQNAALIRQVKPVR